jgi:hypothetical protein
MEGRDDDATTGGDSDLAMPAAADDDDDDITDSDEERKDDGETHYTCAQTETRDTLRACSNKDKGSVRHCACTLPERYRHPETSCEGELDNKEPEHKRRS